MQSTTETCSEPHARRSAIAPDPDLAPAIYFELPNASNAASASAPTQNFIEPAQAKALLGDLFTARPAVYWLDLLACVMLGYGGFAVLFVTAHFSALAVVAGFIASAALYRALIFSHEIAHLRASSVPGFKFVWNLTVGIPLLMPSILYAGMHDDHHRTQTYGTERDPEYQPFAGARLQIVLFTLHSVLIYPLLFLRFFVAAPIGLLVPPLHRLLEQRASSFTMNPKYVRRLSAAQRNELYLWELAILGFWAGLAVILFHFGVFAKFVTLFLIVVQPIAVVNALRTLAAHRYQPADNARDKRAQVLDSVDVPGTFLSALWAPIGLRYHALHHYFPTLPYHNLGTAYQRLTHAISARNRYHETREPGLWRALLRLWRG